jgi:ABC-2 type transport system ATP-binding protein
MRDMLRHFAVEGRTVLVSSHLLTEVAQTVDDVVVIAKGRRVAQAPLSELADGADDLEQVFFNLVNAQSLEMKS